MSPRAGTTRTFTVSFPPDLADQVERLAARESRTTSELFREAFRTYRTERIRALFGDMHAQVQANGAPEYTEEAIERFVDEDRAEQWALKQASKQ